MRTNPRALPEATRNQTAGSVAAPPAPLARPTLIAIPIGIALAVTGMWAGDRAYGWVLIVLVSAAGAFLSVIDLRTRRLPNRWVAPLGVVGIIQVVGVMVAGDLIGGLVAAASAAAVFIVLAGLALPGWMGFGDVKYAASLALFGGVLTGMYVLYALPIAVVAGGVLQLIQGRSKIAFGPALTVGFLAVMVLAMVMSG